MADTRPKTNVQPMEDISNYVLGSLVTAVFLLALAGATNGAVWGFLGVVWLGIAVSAVQINRR